MALATNDIQRSIGKMLIHTQRAMARRQHAADAYGIAEREEQFQISIYGKVGSEPAQIIVPLDFTNHYALNAGAQRDANLETPQVRVGWDMELAPIGFVPYAHVAQWTYDDADWISGCKLTIGVMAPALAVADNYLGRLHIAFQGWGAPFDTSTDISPDDGTS